MITSLKLFREYADISQRRVLMDKGFEFFNYYVYIKKKQGWPRRNIFQVIGPFPMHLQLIEL